MNRRLQFWFCLAVCSLLFPFRSPAPLIYTPGEGWSYETANEMGKWQRPRAKEQLDAAQQFFNSGDYSLALKASHRVIRMWPFSDYAPRAQYLNGRSLEAMGNDEKAFDAYQVIIEKYPKSTEFEEVLWRQYQIAGRFLNGEWFRLWGYIPLYPSMDQTAEMFTKIVKNGPYSDVAPHAQLRVGAAREKQKNYPEAVQAYSLAADRYHDRPRVAADALFREGASYAKQVQTAEYDQGTAIQAIAAFTDFVTLFPDDKRVPHAQRTITAIKTEQVRGNFEIARFYESSRRWNGALVYYNEVLQLDPNSPYAAQARQRIDALKPRAIIH